MTHSPRPAPLASPPSDPVLACPFPIARYPAITLAHGGGGRLTAQLIDQIFRPLFGATDDGPAHDGALVSVESSVPPNRLAFTADAFVVRPIFFPGGDIGQLAITGSCNDLAMCGAQPRHLSCTFILEEGLPTADLIRVAASMAHAARAVGARIVCGDTKVVERGKGDGVYISTSALGTLRRPQTIGPAAIRPGDAIVLSGDVGRHGMAVLASREGFAFDSAIESDCAHLWPLIDPLLRDGVDIHCLRDLTRGGLATALCELAEQGGHSLTIDERAATVSPPVRDACELLGLDPLYVACEGRCIAIVPAAQADAVLRCWRSLPDGAGATLLGHVDSNQPASPAENPMVHMRLLLGGVRPLDRLSGEQLPRIC